MNHWDKALLQPKRYKQVLDRLRKRAQDEPRFLRSSALYPELSLFWVFLHERKVLNTILKALKSKAGFTFSAHKWAIVRTDKDRNFYIADWPERILLMVMAEILREKIDPLVSNRVFSFRKGSGAHRALQDFATFVTAHKGQALFVMKRDVQSYGDSIKHKKLMALIEERTDLKESSVFRSLLEQSIRIPFRTSADAAETCMYLGIPSGSPMVPQFENFFLTPLDEILSAFPDSFYGRYGDDFIFATPHYEDAMRVNKAIDEQIESLGLKIKPEKKKNYYFTYQTHRDFNRYPEFAGAVRLEWLGASLLAKGKIGCKAAHFDKAQKYLRTEILALVKRLSTMEFEKSIKEKTLSKGIRDLLDPIEANSTRHVLYGHHNYDLAKLLDEQVTQTTVRALRNYWQLKPREAWRVFRRLKVPSIFYNRMGQISRRGRRAA